MQQSPVVSVPVSSSQHLGRLADEIALHLQQLAALPDGDSEGRRDAIAAIASARDAMLRLGHDFDAVARLRLYFLDWTDYLREAEAKRRAVLGAAQRALRERMAGVVRATPAPSSEDVTGLRLELSGAATHGGAELLRLYAALSRTGTAVPYLVARPSRHGVPLAHDPAPAWVLSFSLPILAHHWQTVRAWIAQHTLQVRAWDYRPEAAGRADAPVCADVTDLFHRELATPLSVANGQMPGLPEALRGAGSRG
ncbi:hypothetical protein [Cupriavidus sp. TMH.W2]|uniref:hypothetical protein n=1 Tax=Cupriavidus sp. TMH.W2 TaxID=3434465 RepID=UPI003D7886FD